jgi:pterin-4a-carbinolamine dehydratase
VGLFADIEVADSPAMVGKTDADLRHDGVTVRLITSTDDYYGVRQRDVEMARQISAAAPSGS